MQLAGKIREDAAPGTVPEVAGDVVVRDPGVAVLVITVVIGGESRKEDTVSVGDISFGERIEPREITCPVLPVPEKALNVGKESQNDKQRNSALQCRVTLLQPSCLRLIS